MVASPKSRICSSGCAAASAWRGETSAIFPVGIDPYGVAAQDGLAVAGDDGFRSQYHA